MDRPQGYLGDDWTTKRKTPEDYTDEVTDFKYARSGELGICVTQSDLGKAKNVSMCHSINVDMLLGMGSGESGERWPGPMWLYKVRSTEEMEMGSSGVTRYTNPIQAMFQIIQGHVSPCTICTWPA